MGKYFFLKKNSFKWFKIRSKYLNSSIGFCLHYYYQSQFFVCFKILFATITTIAYHTTADLYFKIVRNGVTAQW